MDNKEWQKLLDEQGLSVNFKLGCPRCGQYGSQEIIGEITIDPVDFYFVEQKHCSSCGNDYQSTYP